MSNDLEIRVDRVENTNPKGVLHFEELLSTEHVVAVTMQVNNTTVGFNLSPEDTKFIINSLTSSLSRWEQHTRNRLIERFKRYGGV